MLRREQRLTRLEGFSPVLKKGTKAASRAFVVSLLLSGRPETPKAGIIVGKREVPLSSARNRVKRKVRHVLAARLDALPRGTRVVVRALSGAKDMTSEEVGVSLDRLLASALNKAEAKGGVTQS